MDTFVVSVCPLDPDSSDFGDVCALYAPFLHQLTMQSSLFERGCPVLVVACIARKLHPCPSYSRRRDRINLGLWRSLYKGGGYKYLNSCKAIFNLHARLCFQQFNRKHTVGGRVGGDWPRLAWHGWLVAFLFKGTVALQLLFKGVPHP